jgi:transposase
VVCSAGRVKTMPEALEVLGASLEPTDRVAMEVSGGSWEVARILEGHVQKVIVVSPDDTGIARARTKTDRLDARVLAKLLWQGELDAVWMPGVLRRRLSRREQLARVARARCMRC